MIEKRRLSDFEKSLCIFAGIGLFSSLTYLLEIPIDLFMYHMSIFLLSAGFFLWLLYDRFL